MSTVVAGITARTGPPDPSIADAAAPEPSVLFLPGRAAHPALSGAQWVCHPQLSGPVRRDE